MKKLKKKDNILFFKVQRINKHIKVLLWQEKKEDGSVEDNSLQGSEGELSIFAMNNFFEVLELPEDIKQDNQSKDDKQ